MPLEGLFAAMGAAVRDLVDPLDLRVAELQAAGQEIAIDLSGVRAALGDLGGRLQAFEARAPEPGPAGPPGPEGPPGPAGKDGKDGLNGKDAQWQYCGTFVTGKTYDVGDLVTDHGSLFYCKRTTTGRPAASSDWTLMVKRGQDGKDAR
jgi:hypothetical protein